MFEQPGTIHPLLPVGVGLLALLAAAVIEWFCSPILRYALRPESVRFSFGLKQPDQ